MRQPVNKPIVISYKTLQTIWESKGLCRHCGKKVDTSHSPKLCKRMQKHRRKGH